MSAYSDLPIVILGASFGGISCVHHVYNKVLKELSEANSTFTYRLVLISPSTHLFWNISAPRGLVSPVLIPQTQNFIPIAKGFEHYDPSRFEFIQGTVTKVNTRAASVTIALHAPPSASSPKVSTDRKRLSCLSARSGVSSNSDRTQFSHPSTGQQTSERVVKYHSLIIATGTTSHSDLFSLHGSHEKTRDALDAFHVRLPTAQTVVIAGSGASGVEAAGQIAYYYNMRGSIPQEKGGRQSKGKAQPLQRKRIILYSSSSELLPAIKSVHGLKAKRQLEELGVEVYTGIRVTRSSYSSATGFTTLQLSPYADQSEETCPPTTHDKTIVTDLYIPCTGVSPNSSFLPDALLDMNGYLRTNRDHNGDSTLRVPVPLHLMPRDGRDPDRDSASSPTRTANKRMSTLSALSFSSSSVTSSDRERDFKHSSMIGSNSARSESGFDEGLFSPALATIGTSASIAETEIKTAQLNPRIYAIGDVADYSADCIQDVYAAMPVLEQNLIIDLLSYQLVIAAASEGSEAKRSTLPDQRAPLSAKHDSKIQSSYDKVTDISAEAKEKRDQLNFDLIHLASSSMSYHRDNRESILIPIGGHLPPASTLPPILARPRWFLSSVLRRTWQPGGVGALAGRSVPAFIVWLLKGRTYRIDEAERVVKQGVSPYPYQEGERRPGGRGGGKAGLG